MSSTRSSASSSENLEHTSDKQSLLKTLIRYVAHTFYAVPSSHIVEYIYHYECISLEELARLLLLTPKKVQSYIQGLKRDKLIIEEHRGKPNSGSNRTLDPSTLYYRIDIISLVNVLKYRLLKMQFEIKDFEQQESSQQMSYKCEKCPEKYSEWDMARLLKISLEDDLKCPRCSGIIREDRSAEEEEGSIRCSLSLFNEQMTRLFQILERIDEIMKIEETTPKKNEAKDIVYIDTNESDGATAESNDRVQGKPLPEWFTRD